MKTEETKRPKCETCVYWYEFRQNTGDDREGECRRRAPRWIGHEVSSDHAVTLDSFGCGEHSEVTG